MRWLTILLILAILVGSAGAEDISEEDVFGSECDSTQDFDSLSSITECFAYFFMPRFPPISDIWDNIFLFDDLIKLVVWHASDIIWPSNYVASIENAINVFNHDGDVLAVPKGVIFGTLSTITTVFANIINDFKLYLGGIIVSIVKWVMLFMFQFIKAYLIISCFIILINRIMQASSVVSRGIAFNPMQVGIGAVVMMLVFSIYLLTLDWGVIM